MRRLGLVVLAFVAVKAFGNVDIPSPTVESRGAEQVLAKCDGHSSKGCTKLEHARMLCECLEEKDGWRIDASVRAVPSIYIANISWLQHEMQHVWDFKFYLRSHVKALEARRYETREACDRMLRAATDAFPETVQRIGRLSAERRDGKMIARSEDHLVVMKAEIVPQLVDDRLANLGNDVPAIARNTENGTAENRDLIGQRGRHVEAALRKSNAAVNAKQLVAGRSFAKDVAVFVSRLFFNHDDDVVEEPRELVRQLFESLFDELVEFRRA